MCVIQQWRNWQLKYGGKTYNLLVVQVYNLYPYTFGLKMVIFFQTI